MGSITLGNPQFFNVVVIVVVLFLIFIGVDFFLNRFRLRTKLLLASLRLCAVVLLAVCLLEPQFVSRRAIPGQNIVALLADDSASLNVGAKGEFEGDSEPGRSLGTVYKNLLTTDASWMLQLQNTFDVRRTIFGSTVKNVEGFQTLKFDAPASNFQGAIESLATRYQNRPVGALLLFSDGNFTNSSLDEMSLTAPIYPVVPDLVQKSVDVSIGKITTSESLFENSPVTVQAKIHCIGEVNEPVVVSISLDGDEKQEFQKLVLNPTRDEQLLAKFDLRPVGKGVFFYKLTARLQSETDFDTDDLQTQEATLINNQKLVVVNRDPHVARILYVAGRPNWEHKFLTRALAEDSSLQLVSLVRIADREPKFDFQGRAIEGSSLFRAFKDGDVDETDDTTQPIMVRLNTRDQSELSLGFPKIKSELFQYDAIILDAVESNFFTRDQLALIESFVSSRGGGFSMLGGVNSFSNGNWKNTPVADILPSYLAVDPVLGGAIASASRSGGRFELSREGLREPWLRFRDIEVEELSRLQNLPAFEIQNRERGTKPGARLLANVKFQNGQSSPAVVIQNFGNGRSASILLGDLWRMSLNHHPQDAGDDGKFWRQFCSWLTGDSPRRISASVNQQVAGNQPVFHFSIRLLDENYVEAVGEAVNLTVTLPDGSSTQLTAQESLESPGLYEAIYSSRLAGGFRAAVHTTAKNAIDGQPLETIIGWTSDPLLAEFEEIAFQLPRLEALAEATGGHTLKISELPKFVEDLQFQELPQMTTDVRPLWHSPLVVLFALTLLSFEWGIRRLNGLP